MDYLTELHDEYSRCQEDYYRVIQNLNWVMAKELRYLTYVRFGLRTVTKLQFIITGEDRCFIAFDAAGQTVNASSLLSMLSVEGCMFLRHFEEIGPLDAVITANLRTLKVSFEELPVMQMMGGKLT